MGDARMSDIPSDWRGQLDLRQELARIDRDRAETCKLQEESEKSIAEQRKLLAESRKLDRDRWLAPWSLLLALMGGVGLGIVQLVAHLAGWWR